jgi:hypothetical protein
VKWSTFVSRNEHNPKVLRLDDEHLFKFVYGDIAHFEDKGWPRLHEEGMELVLVGGMMQHRTHDDQTCGGYVCFARPLEPSEYEARAPIWEVQSLVPLTISPSVQCHCAANINSHGFILRDKWVAA